MHIANEFGFTPDSPVFGRKIPRKIMAGKIATFMGKRYYFPHALPCEVVFFVDGQPLDASAQLIEQDLFGFDVWPENSAASPDLSHTHDHITHNPRKTWRWDSLSIRRSLRLAVAKIALWLLRVAQNDRICHRCDDAWDRGCAMFSPEAGLRSAFCADSADIHRFGR